MLINYSAVVMMPRILLIVAAITVSSGCAKEIGDPCETSVDCDIQNKRICDLTQPGGYCTLKGCEKGTCPEEAECILFRPEPERLSSTWCMATCDDDDDCRKGYVCKNAEELGEIRTLPQISEDAGTDAEVETLAAPIARNLDKASVKFCTVAPITTEE